MKIKERPRSRRNAAGEVCAPGRVCRRGLVGIRPGPGHVCGLRKSRVRDAARTAGGAGCPICEKDAGATAQERGYSTATASTSTFAPLGSAATATQERAGASEENVSAYTLLTA